MSLELNRREFLGVAAGAAISTITPPAIAAGETGSVVAREVFSKRRFTDEEEMAIFRSLQENNAYEKMLDAITKKSVDIIRNCSLDLPRRQKELAKLINFQQLDGMPAACARQGANSLMIGKDPVFEDPALREYWKEIVEGNVDLVQRLQKLQISEIMRNVLAHKQGEEDRNIPIIDVISNSH